MIEGKQIFFLPFTMLPDQERGWSFDNLLESSNKQEQQSGRVNAIVERELQNPRFNMQHSKWNSEDIYMIHHRYIADQAFPGQQAKFSYKSPALSSQWLDVPGLKMVSWHLHQPFSYKNYLCIGSVWHTSPLEYNQSKFWCVIKDDGRVEAETIIINPYIHWSLEQIATQQWLSHYLWELYKKSVSNFNSQQWNIICEWFQAPSLSSLSITILDDLLSYEHLQWSLDPSIFGSAVDISIKKETMQMEQFVALLETGSQQLTESIADRKTLLLQYIRQKYWEKSEVYEDELRSLKLI
jgi:hypothetical protein